MGVEYVQRYSLDTKGAVMARADFGTDDRLPMSAVDSTVIPALRGALHMLTNAQEIHYSDPVNSYTYADDHAKPADYDVPEDVDLRIVTVTRGGWRAVAMHRNSRAMCGMTIGPTPPVGWTSGVAMCP